MTIFIIYIYFLCSLSLLSFVLYAADKVRAKKGKTRIPEIVLLTLACFGGAGGALFGMYILKHKTDLRSKFHFAVANWTAAFVQSALAVFIMFF